VEDRAADDFAVPLDVTGMLLGRRGAPSTERVGPGQAVGPDEQAVNAPGGTCVDDLGQ
jgi:hypothetical protein